MILADIVEGASYGGDTPGFSGLGSYQPATYELSGLGDPMQIGAAWLSAQMFPVLAE